MKTKPINILLADDDTDDCIFFKEVVEALEFTTNLTAVHDGEQLMQFLNNTNNEFPDVLFLDLNMPRKNGFECLLEIKGSEKLNAVPVIIFSTSFEQEVVNLLYKNGAEHFIRKPAEFLHFKNIIQQTITQFMSDLTSRKRERMNLTSEDDFVLTYKPG